MLYGIFFSFIIIGCMGGFNLEFLSLYFSSMFWQISLTFSLSSLTDDYFGDREWLIIFVRSKENIFYECIIF